MKLWIGLASLKPKPECKRFKRFAGKGACVHIAAWADSQVAFEEHVKKQAEELDCILSEVEDVGLLEARMAAEDYPEEFVDIRARAVSQPSDTVYGHFYSWLHDDSN